MTVLDDRGREAARAIHEAVAGYRPVAEQVPLVARRRTVWQAVQLAAGALAVAGLIGIVALVTDPRDDEVAETTTVPPVTTTTPSPPTTRAEVVPIAPPTTLAAPVTSVPPTTAVDTTPPALTITSPAPETHFESTVVTFRGATEPGASVVAAGKFAVAVDATGNWSIDLVLAPGENGASFSATDTAGNEARATVVVWLDVVEEPKEEPPPEKDFGAYAKSGPARSPRRSTSTTASGARGRR